METKFSHLKISTFYGEKGKGDVNFKTWDYEIKCLMGKHPEEEICHAIRRSVKGDAASVLRRLGVDARLMDILRKFDSIYGDIDTKESLLKKFYACEQEKNESVTTYATRVEELYAQGLEMGALEKRHEEQLKGVLYQGLLPMIKHSARYIFDAIRGYDNFKIELRKIESDMQKVTEDEIKSKCKAANKVEEKSELTEVKDLLQKMNARIETLEKEKESGNRDWYRGGRGGRGYRRGRGRGRGNHQAQGRGRGRGSYQQSRPTSSSTFKPKEQDQGASGYDKEYDNSSRKCYRCGNFGHIARECQENW
jgi:hypothetical protein